ncbi:MAG: sulfatase [Phycisphaerales bacterium]|nr:MAG: sulfatase [Phycisphaerales bacterium]
MDRRGFVKHVGAGISASVLSRYIGHRADASGSATRSDTSQMNVLFIDIEDMTAAAVGCYGNSIVRTPHLDRVAAEGMRFARCYCQAPMCNPSRSSFLTGLRPDTTNVYVNSDPMDQLLPPDALTLPELLRRKGIYAINIGKLFHHTWTAQKQIGAFDRLEFCELPKQYEGVSTGYPKHLEKQLRRLPKPRFRYSPDPVEEKRLAELKAERDRIWQRARKGSREYNRARSMFQQPMANIVGDSGLLEEQELDGRKARMAAHILKEMAQQKKQFFLSVGFSKPHTPLRCPKKYLDLYDFDDIPAAAAPPEKDRNIPAVAKRFGRNYDIFNSNYEHPVTPEAARRAVMAYYACASFIDTQIGLILETLELEGLKDNTIVIIFSDHGFQLGEHNLWSKYTLFEQSTRVPLLVRVPGLTKRGVTCDEIVELVDLLPSLCDLLDITQPSNLEGTSFGPLLARPNQRWKKGALTVCSIAGYVGRSVRTKRWRYAQWRSKKTSSIEKELYDLKADPWEQNNLANDPAYGHQVARLSVLLESGQNNTKGDSSA